MKDLWILILVTSLNFSNAKGQSDFDLNCFSILVGKHASIDGSLFFAHNEDDQGINFVDLHKIPRILHQHGDRQIFAFGSDSIDEPEETFGYLWISGAAYNEEQYLNEFGVAITSNSSRSNVVNGNGRIGHNLRRIVAERAKTSREGVKIAGKLVEKYGYGSSGRVYSIVDPNEAWVFEVANGKHWIARRVPDDEVVIIPNYYVIDKFDKQDTLNYLSSPDIVEYAVSNGWYDPESDKIFNFRKAYCRIDRLEAQFNIARKWVVLNKLSEKQFGLGEDFPFSVKPKHKVSVQELMELMQNHYENTKFVTNPSDPNGCTHYNLDTMRICNSYNDYSCITQLRNWLPADIGNVMWIAPRYPCIQPFIPWYYGINKIPSGYEKASNTDALRDYNLKNRDYKSMYPDHACWVFDDFASKTDRCDGKEIKSVRKWKSAFDRTVSKTVERKEGEIIAIYRTNTTLAKQMLTDLTTGYAERVLSETREKLYLTNSSGHKRSK
jgi:dipeptidase